MSRVVLQTTLSLFFLLSAGLLAIEPPPVWKTEPVDLWPGPSDPASAKAADASSASPFQCSILGPRVDWG